ncbi:MAG: TetR/AcrR family transcriptional regulator [Sphingomonadaceae bacterium]|nr:TetR/AcrR family transcriptional regulator [Sphingomonadaceae bacterium]
MTDQESRPWRLTGRPSPEEAVALGQRVIETAYAIFITRGFVATSFEAVAAAADVNKRTIYRRYETKANLFYAVIRWKFGQFVQRHASEPPKGDELTFLRTLFRNLLDFTLEADVLRLLKVIISESDRFPEIIEQVFLGRTTRLALIIEDALCALADRGMLHIPDVVAARKRLVSGVCADAWLMPMLGLSTLQTREERDLFFEERWASVLTQYSAKSANL